MTDKHMGGINVPNSVAFAVIGLGIGLLTGILLARKHGWEVAGDLKDGGHLMQVEAYKYSRTSLPVGAAIGTVAGAVVGFLVGKLTKTTTPTYPIPKNSGVEGDARTLFASEQLVDSDAIRTVDNGVREYEKDRTSL
jgi:hypothetical protein